MKAAFALTFFAAVSVSATQGRSETMTEQEEPSVWGSPAQPSSGEGRPADAISVRDFGAVGDGVADDTQAIQAALDTGRKKGRLCCVYQR